MTADLEVTVVLTDSVAAELAGASRGEVESAAVGLAGIVRTEGRLRLLVTELVWVPDSAYERRDRNGLVVSSRGFVPALGRAESEGRMAVWIHTHPGGTPVPSIHDERVDLDLDCLFRERTSTGAYASLVVSPADSWCGLDLTGRAGAGGMPLSPVARVVVVGDRLAVHAAYDSPAAEEPAPVQQPGADDAMFGRQVRAFGGPVQRALGDLRVAVVGAGGTGSAVIEQLVRLGVRNLLLADPDVLSASNVTRVYGSGPDDVGRPKAAVARDHVLRVAPDAVVRTLDSPITARETAQELRAADLAFGCTDDNAGRQVLSRLSAYYLLPVIDCGVLLDSAEGRLNGIYGRVTVLTPGSACLICRGRVDLARAAAELLPAAEREARVREGYAPELAGVEPAVVAYTTLTAALAVNELLDRMVGHGARPAPSEVLARVHDRELSTNTRQPRSGHYCDPAQGLLGAGDREPFLEQAWAT